MILDVFSATAFRYEWEQVRFGPDDWREVLERERPALLFVESAWHGNDGRWATMMSAAGAPKQPVRDLVAWCREQGIPTVFWNKEDPPNFDRFIESAELLTGWRCCRSARSRGRGRDGTRPLPTARRPARNRRRPARPAFGLFTLWVVFLWVPLTLLGGMLYPVHPKLRLPLPRYWYPVFPVFTLGGLTAIWLLSRAVARRGRARTARPSARCATPGNRPPATTSSPTAWGATPAPAVETPPAPRCRPFRRPGGRS